MRVRHLLALFALQLAVGALFLAPSGPGFPLDDTWIHMVYARALGQGQGFAYNPGQLETGVTAPLWTTLLTVPVAVADLLGRRPDLGVRVLAGLAGLAMAWAGWRVAARSGLWPAMCAAVVLTVDPQLVFDRFSGMEMPLFGLLTLLLVDALDADKPRRAGLICGALLLTRPEGALLVLLALGWTARRRGSRGLVALLLPAALCVAPWITYCQLVSHVPWPSTWSNKAELVLEPARWGAALLAVLRDTGWGWALPVAALVGAYVLEGGRHLLGRLCLACALVLLPGVLLTRPIELVGDPPSAPYYWARYLLLAWPVLVMLAGVGLASLLRTAYAGTRCRPLSAAVLIGPVLAVAALARGLPAQAPRTAAAFAAQCADTEALNVAAGYWVAQHLDSRALVATHDAGAVRFFGGRPVLDVWGNHSGGLRTALREGGEQGAADWLSRQHPDALVVFPALYAAGHSPELAALWSQLPPQEYQALMASTDDLAAFFGLTHRAETFHVEQPSVVPSPLHADLAIFVRP